MRKPGVLIVKCALFLALLVFEAMPLALAQPKQTGVEANRIVLGKLTNGAEVAFMRAGEEGWGIEISGSAVPRETQPKPAQIEVYRGEHNVSELAAGYQSLRKETGGIIATAKLEGGGKASFTVDDEWKISGNVVSLNRKVSVIGPGQMWNISLPACSTAIHCTTATARLGAS
jgi:hypothetical protein